MENEAYRRFLAAGDSDRLVEALSREQFLKPHQSVGDAVGALVHELGVCPGAVEAAIDALNVQSGMSIGRIRRTELMQLGRSIHRFWRQAVVEETTPSHPD